MGSGFDYQGASGKHYSFALVDVENAKSLPLHGGVIVVAEDTPEPLWIGYADSIRAFEANAYSWAFSKERFKKPVLYVHPSNPGERKTVVADLIEFYSPMLNGLGI